jgi:microcystin-dependent protein
VAEITGMTADAMLAIAADVVVSGNVDGSGHLILTKHDASTLDAGDVTGPKGDTGDVGPEGPLGIAPTGTIVMYAAGTAPSGWLICDGTAVSRVTFSSLFTLIGTTYGAGNGTTTFNLPNMQTKFPRQDTAHLGATGGATTHGHTVQGGATPVTAQIKIAQGSPGPNIWINRQSGDTWTANFSVSAPTTTNTNSDSNNNGALVTGVTAVADHTPQYLNVNFMIKF